MEIERINENTVKFFLSYIDIEERGFTREEVWYNREKSEELFWEMMDEINEEAEFEVEGPLWIQVHAKSNGIEVTVTRANSEDGDLTEPPFDQESLESMTDSDVFHNAANLAPLAAEGKASEWLENTFIFDDFEDIIRLAGQMKGYEADTSLYAFENNYYLHVVYDTELMDDKRKADMLSVLSEYGAPSNVTIHRLVEYGTTVMASDVFDQISKYF